MPLVQMDLASQDGPKARECATLPGGFKGRGVYRAAHQHLLKRHREGCLPHRNCSAGPIKLALLVEVGAFPGQSSCVMAQLLLATPKAERAHLRFHVVDRFGGPRSFPSAKPAVLQDINSYGSSRAVWAKNMIETGSMQGIDQVSRASSVDRTLLSQYANNSVAFMYLDTSHSDRMTRCARCAQPQQRLSLAPCTTLLNSPPLTASPSAFAFPGLSLPPGGRRYKTAGGCAGRTTVAPQNAPQSTISFSKLACRCTTGVTASSARAREWMPARAVVRRRSLTKGAEGPRQVAVGFARTTAQRFGVEGRSEDLTNLTHDLLPLASIEYRIVQLYRSLTDCSRRI